MPMRRRNEPEKNYLRQWQCEDCDVQWRGRNDADHCWLCGGANTTSAPIFYLDRLT